jgi:hypothetical protein
MGYFVAAIFATMALYLLFEIRNNLRQLTRRIDAMDPLLVSLQTQIADAAIEASEARAAADRLTQKLAEQSAG